MPANFHARFSGVCKAGANCPKGGKVVVGDYVTWGREKGQRGIIYHVDCLNRPGQEYVPVNVEVEPITEPKLATTLVSSDRSDLAELLAESISKYLPKAESKLDEPRVLELIRANQAPQATEVIVHDARAMEVKEMGVQHCLFPSLLKVLSAKDASGHSLNVWLTGPAGSGKTTAARNCAEALNLEFRFCGALDNQYGLIGYNDANGKTVRTPFREAYENGGVFLFDEVDASSPNAILCFNAALANGHCAFPDAIVKRHADCVIVAAANTWGLGATNDYVGRMKLDAAFIDRFVQLNWDIDEMLERTTCGNESWFLRVKSVRDRARNKGLKVVISPRASYYGSALLTVGIPQSEVETMTLKKAMTAEQWESVKD